MRRLLPLLAVLAGLLVVVPQAIAAPTDTFLPVVSGTLTEGQQLAVTQGVWDNTTDAPSTFTYQWQRCTSGCINIPWAVESGYVPTRADVGAVLKAQVTGTDAAGNATTITSGPTTPIASNGVTAYYVDGASTGGTCSDAYTATQAQSASTPWCSIQNGALPALKTTSTDADVLVRACANCADGGTKAGYGGNKGAGYLGNSSNGVVDLTNDKPTGSVTLEPYGTNTTADNVLLSGVFFENTRNYNFDGFNIGDPANSTNQSGAGCPYIAQAGGDNLAGNLPSADYCQPNTDISLNPDTTNVSLNDDNVVEIIDSAATGGNKCPSGGTVYCPISGLTLYGDRFHNPGWDCSVYTGMTTSAPIAANVAITSVPISPTTPTTTPGLPVPTTIPAGARLSLITGSQSNPTSLDQTGKTTLSTAPGSSSIGLSSSFTPKNAYSSGTQVIVEYCAGSAFDLMLHADVGEGIGNSAPFSNWTVEHSQFDHSNWAMIAQGGDGMTYAWDTFDYGESANSTLSHAEILVNAQLTNFIFDNNLVYMSGEGGIISLCNGTGPHTPCGSNFTIENNVFTGCPGGFTGGSTACVGVANSVSGTNYLINNTLWSGKTGQVNGSFSLTWNDARSADCCTTAGTYGKWTIENNIFDVLSAGDTGEFGSAGDEIATEDYNLISNTVTEVVGTLSAGLSTASSGLTSISVNPLNNPIPSGRTITLKWYKCSAYPTGCTTPAQNLTTTAPAAKGATTIQVSAFTPSQDWPATSTTIAGGYGAHDIIGQTPLFATPIGSSCKGDAWDDTNATDAVDNCTAGANGNFNAALLSGSTGIGGGTSTGTNVPTIDHLGNTRSGAQDIGAFQFNVDGLSGGGGAGGGGTPPNGPPLPLPPFLLIGGALAGGGGIAAWARRRKRA